MRADSAPVSLALSAVSELVELFASPMIVDATCVSRKVGDNCQPKSSPPSAVSSLSRAPLIKSVWRPRRAALQLSDIVLPSITL